MFTIGKLFGFFVLPPGFFIIVLTIISFFLFKKSKRLSLIIAFTAFFLYIISTKSFSNILLSALETDYYANDIPSDIDSITVLGGGSKETVVNNKKIYSLTSDSLNRINKAFFIWKNHKVPIILSGGAIFGSSKAEALIMADYLTSMGVNMENIITDTLSRNTKENAKNIETIVTENQFKKTVLITSGYHLKRSIILFKKRNINFIPSASDIIISEKNFSISDLMPESYSLYLSSIAFHEYAGIIYALLCK